MSLRVLVICEDGRLDKFIAKPLLQLVLKDLGKPKAQIEVYENPRVMGIDHATRIVRENLEDWVSTHKIWVFLPDGDAWKPDQSCELKDRVQRRGAALVIAAFMPELEILACAPFVKELGISVADLRGHHRLKEDVYVPFAQKHFPQEVGNGRKAAMRQVEANWKTIKAMLPEITELSLQLKTILESSSSAERDRTKHETTP